MEKDRKTKPEVTSKFKKPPLGKLFKTRCKWYSYDSDGESETHGPTTVVAVRYEEDDYAFVPSGKHQYLYTRLGEFTEWELV